MKFHKFISYCLHPIIFPIIGTLLFFIFIPKHISKNQEYIILLTVFIGTYIVPIFLLTILKKLKMINGFHLESIEERKFPTILFITLSFVLGNMLFKIYAVRILSFFFYGYSVGLFFSYIFLLIHKKISLHALAISGLIGFIIFFSYYFQLNLLVMIAFLFIISGVVASSRLHLMAHKAKEVYLGFFIGLISQMAVFSFLYNM